MNSMYYLEFLSLTIAHLLALMAPGPDFFIVVSNSLRFGRSVGFMTAAGIASGLIIHVIYSLLGLSFLQNHPEILSVIRVLGGLYLLYLAIPLLRTSTQVDEVVVDNAKTGFNRTQAFLNGFLTNLLNPKALLFFVAILSSLISSTTPDFMKVVYGVWIPLSSMLWFMLVASLFTRPLIRQTFLRYAGYVNYGMAAFFILVASYVFASALGFVG